MDVQDGVIMGLGAWFKVLNRQLMHYNQVTENYMLCITMQQPLKDNYLH